MITHQLMKCHGNGMIVIERNKKSFNAIKCYVTFCKVYLSDRKSNFKITITRNDVIIEYTQHTYDYQILAKICC